MEELPREHIGGTVVIESADTLTLGSTLRGNAVGAMGYGIIAEIIIFVSKIVLQSNYPPIGRSNIVWLGGLMVWLLGFIFLSLRPPLVVRRDGRVLELGNATNQGVRRVVAREKGSFAILVAQTRVSDDERLGRRVMFPTMDEATQLADRINVFLERQTSRLR